VERLTGFAATKRGNDGLKSAARSLRFREPGSAACCLQLRSQWKKSACAAHNDPLVRCDVKSAAEVLNHYSKYKSRLLPAVITATQISCNSADDTSHQTLPHSCRQTNLIIETTAILMLDEFEYDPSAECRNPESILKITRAIRLATTQAARAETLCRFSGGETVGGVCKLSDKVLKRQKNHWRSNAVEQCKSSGFVRFKFSGRESADSKSPTSHGR
jgi:hypothetical protein